MKYASALLVLALTGCSSITDELNPLKSDKEQRVIDSRYVPRSHEGNLHGHVERLARQLFDTANVIDVTSTVAIGTFLPAKTLKLDSDSELSSISIQLQESFSTLVTQVGLTVIEYKSLPGVMVTESADIMLSRDVSKLGGGVSVQYLLTGNYIQQENSLIVNAKLINVLDKSLVAAATDYVPLNSLYSHEKIQVKDGMLYRGEY
jgi:hypothetical protein